MYRLSSYLIYPIICLSPVLPLSAFYFNMDLVFKGNLGSVLGVVFLLAIFGWFVFLAIKSKRVYYKNNTLHLYSLFSNKLTVVNKDNIEGAKRLIFYDPTVWKIVYYDDNKNAKHIYFIRNAFCDQFKDIIDELNS